ncbi:MAG TPA: serine/threonine-protein kinase [Kofleriaceae bacterium]|nr:serine/threonine-protein kinase [Kofleriaceae bacterium]
MELAFAPGTVLLGKYRVESVLGRGGMGMVLRVTHLHLGEELAIKVLLPSDDATIQDELAARFVREAQAAARLRGEHVARVVDVGRLPDGPPYMVMEYLHGTDLARTLKARGALPVGEAVDYVLQACEALAEAHARDIVHRDIKPANLFLTARPDGSPLLKVLDFGISKAPIAHDALTRTDTVMGTAGYMSPEQMKATKDVDARADIWALGVVLYECLCGRPPFSGTSFSAVVLMAGTEPPPPMDPRIPRGLQSAVLRCLEKDRKARFGSIAALVTALAPFARDGRAAAMIAERTSSMLPRATLATAATANLRVAPELGTAPTQGPATTAVVRSSRGRWIVAGIAGVAIAAIGGGVAIFAARGAPDAAPLASAGSDAATAAVVPDAAPVAEIDAGLDGPPGSPPTGEPSAAAVPVLQRCAALAAAKQWSALLDCGTALAALDPARGDDVKRVAQREATNERAAQDIQAQIQRGALKDAQLAIKQFPSDSVYASELEQAFERADLALVQDKQSQANALLTAHNCDALSQLTTQLTITGTERMIAMIQAAQAKCVAAPRCDQAAFDDWISQAAYQFNAGHAQPALALIIKAINCNPDVRLFRFAATYACAARDVEAARFYFSKVPAPDQPAIAAKCRQEHIELVSGPSGG